MGADRPPFGVFREFPILIARRLPLWVAAALLAPALAAAQPLSATAVSESPPSELAEGLRVRFAETGARVSSGGTVLEFWWIASLEGAEGGWSAVREGSLVGAVRIGADYRDIRGRRIKPGVYTLRFALQPPNGDHLGVSPFREFLLVIPAAADTDPRPAGHDRTIELSKQTTGASHPSVWSIDPPASSDPPLSAYTNDAGHHGLVFEIAGALRFGLILVGKIEA
jgi:hypothetical protein